MCEALGMRIGVLGGTGPAGQGIAARLAARRPRRGRSGRATATGPSAIVDELRAQWGDRVATLEPAPTPTPPTPTLVVLATVWDAAVADRRRARRAARRQGRDRDGERPREGRPRVPPGAARRGLDRREAIQAAAPDAHGRRRASISSPPPRSATSTTTSRATSSSSATTTTPAPSCSTSSTASPTCAPSTPDSLAQRARDRGVRRRAAHGQPPPQGRGARSALDGDRAPPHRRTS